MFENSPAFQRRERVKERRVPKGRLNLGAESAVPSGLIHHEPNPGVETDFSAGVFIGHLLKSTSLAQRPAAECV